MLPTYNFIRSVCLTVLAIVTFVGSVAGQGSASDRKAVTFFESKIRPVLVTKCYRCHSADAVKKGRLKGGLQLDTREGIRKGGDTGPGIVPGKPDKSLILAALRYESVEMPPSGKLSPQILNDFEKWIADGAHDPRDGKPIVTTTIDFTKARQFWSLRPLKAPTIPTVHKRNAESPIDRFVQAKLEKEGLDSTELASPEALVRRIHFDLIGLPPSPQVVRAFIKESQSGANLRPAVEKLVDQLLASPQFGEHWARHWLDVARYAESNGRARNMVWHHAWRYRNYVIDAFNKDKPFDQFIREQLAGDLMTAPNREQRDEQIIATGFLALGPKSLEERNRRLFQMDVIDEQIDVITRGFLGLSVSCARCHDHKFDPVPTHDYYALAGILRSTDTLYGLGPKGIRGVNDADLQPIGLRTDLAKAAAVHLEKVKAQTQARNTARSGRYRVVRNVASRKQQLKKPGTDVEKVKADIERMEAEIREWDARIKKMDEVLADLIAHPPAQPDYAMAARDQSKPQDCRIHVRGEVSNLSDVAPRGVLQVIHLPGRTKIEPTQSGRRVLADWIASPHNPLTPRVAVNRIWQRLFGRGLVSTPDDFGVNGSRPSHPELLDYLAVRFVEQNWSMKNLIREIVLSRTYQLSSSVLPENQTRDPENELLWRMKPRRLPVESMRDAVLTVSGQLDSRRVRGSAVSQLDVFKQDEFNSRTKLTQDQMIHSHRSIYLPIVRGNLPEILKLFDFADPNALIGKRDETSVPAQALFLMNSPWMIGQSRHTAEHLLRRTALNDHERLELLYQKALSRAPDEKEAERALTYLRNSGTEEDRLEKWTQVCQVVLISLEFRYLQ